MQCRYISVTVTLIAGIVACSACILKDYDLISSMIIIISVLIVFFILGTIAKKIIFSVIDNPIVKEDEDDTDDNKDDTNKNEETSNEKVEKDAEIGVNQ